MSSYVKIPESTVNFTIGSGIFFSFIGIGILFDIEKKIEDAMEKFIDNKINIKEEIFVLK